MAFLSGQNGFNDETADQGIFHQGGSTAQKIQSLSGGNILKVDVPGTLHETSACLRQPKHGIDIGSAALYTYA
jgi:ABC-type sugar transport system ATPase subunit